MKYSLRLCEIAADALGAVPAEAVLLIKPPGPPVLPERPEEYGSVSDLIQGFRQHCMTQPGFPALGQAVDGDELRTLVRPLPHQHPAVAADQEVHLTLPEDPLQQLHAVLLLGASIQRLLADEVRKSGAEGHGHDMPR